jgi:DNA-binding PadR family transcriptional regulator
MHGYEMIQELEERTDGIWRPSPGSIYPTLQLLEERGLVVGDDSSGKKLYDLTAEGRAEVLQAEAPGAETPRKPWEEVTDGIDPHRRQLRKSIAALVVAIKQVAEAGTSAQKARVVDILAETRRSIYAVLAEEE